jgi:hypothetical protein
MRPDAWFEYEDVPEREGAQSTPDYLDQHSLWFTTEKQRYLKMTEAIEKRFRGLREVVDISPGEFRRD